MRKTPSMRTTGRNEGYYPTTVIGESEDGSSQFTIFVRRKAKKQTGVFVRGRYGTVWRRLA